MPAPGHTLFPPSAAVININFYFTEVTPVHFPLIPPPASPSQTRCRSPHGVGLAAVFQWSLGQVKPPQVRAVSGERTGEEQGAMCAGEALMEEPGMLNWADRREGRRESGARGCSSPSLRAAAGAHSARVWRERLRAAPERGTAAGPGAEVRMRATGMGRGTRTATVRPPELSGAGGSQAIRPGGSRPQLGTTSAPALKVSDRWVLLRGDVQGRCAWMSATWQHPVSPRIKFCAV